MTRFHNYAVTNTQLHKCDSKPLANPAAIWERMQKLKSKVYSRFDEIEGIGIDANKAISLLHDAAIPSFTGMRECDWSGVLIEALTADPNLSRANMVEDVVRLAIRLGHLRLIEKAMDKFAQHGVLDRKLCATGDVSNHENLKLFELVTDHGQALWSCVAKRMLIRFLRPHSVSASRMDATQKYDELICCGPTGVSVFISDENERYRTWLLQGRHGVGQLALNVYTKSSGSCTLNMRHIMSEKLMASGWCRL